MNILLIICLAILAGSVVIGAKKGFVKMLVSMISVVVAIGLTMIFAPMVTTWVEENTTWEAQLNETIQQEVIPNFVKSFEGTLGGVLDGLEGVEGGRGLEEIFNSVGESSEQIKLILEKIMGEGSVDFSVAGLLTNMFGGVETAIAELSANMSGALAEKLAHTIILVASYILVFIISLILVRVLGSVLNLAAKLPVIKQMNGLLGGALGALQGFLIVDAMLLIISLLSLAGVATNLMAMVQENPILTWLNNYNIFLMVLHL